MAKTGRGAAALATAAIGSFIAGTIGTLALALLAPQIVELAIKMGSPDYFAIMVLAFIAVTTVLGSSKIRGLASLGIGLLIGTDRHRPDLRPAAADPRHPRARRRHRRRRRRGRPVRRRRGAVGRRAPAPQPGRDHQRRRRPDEPRGLAPLVEAVAARHGDRLPVRRRPRRRRGDPDLPVVRRWRRSSPSTPRSSATAPSRASPAPRRPTTPPPPAASCRCSPSASRPPPPPR